MRFWDVNLREHTYHYEQIVIGSGLNAVLYAYKTNSVFIDNSVDTLFPLDEIGFSYDLGNQVLKPEDKCLDVFNSLAYHMVCSGKAPYSGLVEGIRIIPEENKLNVITKNGHVSRCTFNKLRLFDTNDVSGLPFDEETKTEHYRVLDWFNVRSGMKHDHNFILSDDDFCKKIYFYISKRIDGNKDKKDLVSESLMSEHQLNDFDYSDTIVRLKTISLMKESGIKGTGNGVGKNLPIKLELANREVREVKSSNYVEAGDITFDSRAARELVENNVF